VPITGLIVLAKDVVANTATAGVPPEFQLTELSGHPDSPMIFSVRGAWYYLSAQEPSPSTDSMTTLAQLRILSFAR